MSPSISREDRTKEILDLCLDSESPEMQRRVYEIIHLSGLQPSDPMFLVLALTGQMRVFLETAPSELNRLLEEWKNENAASLSEITLAVALVKETQQDLADVISQNLSDISLKCVADFKEAGMATVSAIADANSETLSQVRKTKKQNEKLFEKIEVLHAEVKKDKEQTLENKKAFAKFVGQTTSELSQTYKLVNSSSSDLKKLQNKTQKLSWANWFAPLSALAIAVGAGLLAGGWLMSLKYNTPVERFGRNVTDWNMDRIENCFDTENPKCTLWIVPPDSPQRQE